jgi:hypothetical protein
MSKHCCCQAAEQKKYRPVAIGDFLHVAAVVIACACKKKTSNRCAAIVIKGSLLLSRHAKKTSNGCCGLPLHGHHCHCLLHMQNIEPSNHCTAIVIKAVVVGLSCRTKMKTGQWPSLIASTSMPSSSLTHPKKKTVEPLHCHRCQSIVAVEPPHKKKHPVAVVNCLHIAAVFIACTHKKIKPSNCCATIIIKALSLLSRYAKKSTIQWSLWIAAAIVIDYYACKK